MVTHMKFMDIDQYRHSYEGFCENFICPMFINRGRMMTTRGAHASIARILFSSSYLSLLMKNIKEEIQSFGDHVDITRGWTLEQH